MTALTVRRLPNLATPEQLWSGTWESNPVTLRSERSGFAVFLAPEIRNLNLAGSSGFEPESQPAESWALSRWTMDRKQFGVAGGN